MIDVNNSVQEKTYLLVGCLGAFFAYNFIQMNFLNSISLKLMQYWDIDAKQFSNFSIIYLSAALCSFIPVGLALDSISSRKVILTSMGICIMGTMMFALTRTLLLAETARFIVGMVYSVAILGCFRVIATWFPKRLAFMSGCVTSIGLLGCIVAQTPMALTVQRIGLQQAMLLNVFLGCIIFYLMWLYLHDKKNVYIDIVNKSFFKILFDNLKNIVFLPQLWLCAAYACLLNTPILFLGDLWGTMYLVQVVHINTAQASSIVSMIFVGTIIGCFLLGWVSDKLQNRRFIMIISALLLFSVMPFFLKTALSMPALTTIFLLFGILASAQTLCYPYIAEINPKFLMSTATGFMTMLIMSGNIVLQIIFSRALSFGWAHIKVHGIPLYNYDNYFAALIIMPIAFFSCVIFAFFLRKPK